LLKRVVTLLLIVSAFTLPGFAKKKKPELPDLVLKAQTAAVMIEPGAGEPVNDMSANRIAQENVEKALTKWGRFRVVQDVQTADIVIAVRTGHSSGPTIRNSPTDDRPVTIQPGDGNIRLGGQQGRPPDATQPGIGPPTSSDPRLGTEMGTGDDIFEVFRGGVEYPLDASPVWRYTAKNALKQPPLAAVEQFRKAIDDSEKLRQQKP
jgi:hypothetical protein